MKERLVMINGQRILQAEMAGIWAIKKVLPGGRLETGVYDLYRARNPVNGETYKGVILHADRSRIYQQTESGIILHSPDVFRKIPENGDLFSLQYNPQGSVLVSKIDAVSLVPKIQR